METTSIRADEINREWFIVDAEGQTLGRLASEIAQIIRGKKKPFYTPHMDMGDFVVVVNAENNRGASKNQSSLQKIASFKPNQLKSFSSKISTSIAQRKQSAQIKVAEQAVVKEKVQELRDQNPFKKNNPVEEQKGRKISLSA